MKFRSLITLIILTLGLFACSSQEANTVGKADSEAAANKQVPVHGKPLIGEQLFIACQACHNLAEGAEHKVGPNLFEIIDQPAASREGYTYSKALSSSGLVWNKNTLTGWILATETMVPGTWMAYHNHMSPEEASRLVGYIAKQ